MAEDINITLCRHVLALTRKDVLKHFLTRPFTEDCNHAVFRAQWKRAWVWKQGRNCYEFHGPQDFYWHGRAGNAYDARAKGWNAWLDRQLAETVLGK